MSEFDMKYTGKIIKELREKAGENQEQLAEALGVANRETVARWESGARDLRREHIIALAQHFHVTSDYLLGLSGVSSIDSNLQVACKVTGLSDKAISKITTLNIDDISIFNRVILSTRFVIFLEAIDTSLKIKPVERQNCKIVFHGVEFKMTPSELTSFLHQLIFQELNSIIKQLEMEDNSGKHNPPEE